MRWPTQLRVLVVPAQPASQLYTAFEAVASSVLRVLPPVCLQPDEDEVELEYVSAPIDLGGDEDGEEVSIG